MTTPHGTPSPSKPPGSPAHPDRAQPQATGPVGRPRCRQTARSVVWGCGPTGHRQRRRLARGRITGGACARRARTGAHTALAGRRSVLTTAGRVTVRCGIHHGITCRSGRARCRPRRAGFAGRVRSGMPLGVDGLHPLLLGGHQDGVRAAECPRQHAARWASPIFRKALTIV